MHDRQDIAVETLVGEFLAARGVRKPSVHTLQAYRRDLTSILDLVADGRDVAALPLADLSPRALRSAFARFAAARAPASVYRAWSSWNSFFTFLVTDGFVAGNPMSAVDKPRVAAPAPKPLRGEDTPERLLAAVGTAAVGTAAAGSGAMGSAAMGGAAMGGAAMGGAAMGGAAAESAAVGGRDQGRQRDPWPERDVVVLALALCAGLRLSELLALRTGSFVGRAGERRVEVAGKGGRPRTVPIEPELDAVVRAYLVTRGQRARTRSDVLLLDRRGEPLRRGGLQYLVQSCYRRAGITDRVPRGAQLHALRHTFATRLAEDGANASEIMRLLGHASLTTSQNYIEVTAAQQRAAVRANRTNRALGELAG
jgi:integrase/recombinase XerC